MFWLILFIILLILAISPGLFVCSTMVLYWAIIFFGSIVVPIVLLLVILPELYKLTFQWKKYYGNGTYDRGGRNAMRAMTSLILVLGIVLTAILWSRFPEMAAYVF